MFLGAKFGGLDDACSSFLKDEALGGTYYSGFMMTAR
jgi:hypothetical protein